MSEYTDQRLAHLAELGAGWDDNDPGPPVGKAIDPDCIELARQFLGIANVTPTHDGGVLLSWHGWKGWDMEVEFEPGGTIDIWVRDRNAS